MIRVLLVDDNALMRLGMQMALTVQSDLTCCGTASTGRLAIEQARSLEPDVVVMDLTMPDLDGVEATRLILRDHPEMKVLVLTFRSDRRSIAAALGAGADGYVLKGTTDIDVAEGIRAVHAGRRPTMDIREAGHRGVLSCVST